MTSVPNVRPGALSGLDNKLLSGESGTVEADDATDGTIPEVLASLDGLDGEERAARARELLDAENASDSPRKSLVEKLEKAASDDS